MPDKLPVYDVKKKVLHLQLMTYQTICNMKHVESKINLLQKHEAKQYCITLRL